jgi:hypothetical protein
MVNPTYDEYTDYLYRVVAQNTVGYGAEFPSLTVKPVSVTVLVQNPPKAPTGLPATTYNYRVYAANTVGNSLYSNTSMVVVPAATAAPTNLTATLLSGPRVSLTFKDNANNETGFMVE